MTVQKKPTPWFSIFTLGVAVGTLVFTVLVSVIIPRLVTPKIEFSAEHYFVDTDIAGHRFTISNTGNGAAEDLNLFLTLKPPYEIQYISSSPLYERLEGGQGESTVELYWAAIGPKNAITVDVLNAADQARPESVFPLEFKIWYRDRLVQQSYFGPD